MDVLKYKHMFLANFNLTFSIIDNYVTHKPEFDLRKTRYYVLRNDYQIFKKNALVISFGSNSGIEVKPKTTKHTIFVLKFK